MAVDNLKTIDLIGTDTETGDVILTISDHLEWTEVNEHLKVLQEKINTYLSFIESGEIFESYPEAEGKNLVIEVVGKYILPTEGKNFFNKASSIIKEVGIALRFTTLEKNK